jgi:hypothetical protein
LCREVAAWPTSASVGENWYLRSLLVISTSRLPTGRALALEVRRKLKRSPTACMRVAALGGIWRYECIGHLEVPLSLGESDQWGVLKLVGSGVA